MVCHDYLADYVIIGAGAVGLAFADVILTESDFSVLVVDRQARAGGHWNHAYPFVRLHQPSSFYGVASRPLGHNRIDESGFNAGFYELASAAEVLHYYDALLREQFEPSGRFSYLPMHDYLEGDSSRNLLNGEVVTTRAARRVVDARYLGSVVPSMKEHQRSFTAAPSVQVVTPNELSETTDPYSGYVIVGAGKTSADVAVWLLSNGVDPELITWVRPRDAWFYNRAVVQPGARFARESFGGFAARLEAARDASSAEDLALRFEDAGVFLRIDAQHSPSFFRGATISTHEIDVLRSIQRVVRQGYLRHINETGMKLDGGNFVLPRGQLFIDCTAEGLRHKQRVPVFSPSRITIQYVVNAGLPTYSAALTAIVELSCDNDQEKNAHLRPAPITGSIEDVAHNLLVELGNQSMWSTNRRIRKWIDGCRLNPAHEAMVTIDPNDVELLDFATRVQNNLGPAADNLRSIVDREPTVAR